MKINGPLSTWRETALGVPHDALKIAKWFPNNDMKLNEDKCHLMVFGDKSNNVSIKIGSTKTNESTEEKLLGVICDKILASNSKSSLSV